MTHNLVLTVVAVVLGTLVAIGDADAKRLGGGRSLGAQRQSVAPPASSTGPAANPVMPAQPGAAAAAPAAAAPSGASRWLGPIAGIAAGLGIAALLSHFGLPEGFGTFLLLGLVAFGIVLAFRMLAARRASAAAPALLARAASTGYVPASGIASARVEPTVMPPQSATPSTNFAKALPAGFDAPGFLREAKLQFRRLQSAWDAGDRKAIADVMTPAMAAEILSDLDARGAHQPTEVVALDAEMLDVTTDATEHWASVRFTGTVREDGGATTPLDEIWNLSKPIDGSTGWLLAGIRQTA